MYCIGICSFEVLFVFRWLVARLKSDPRLIYCAWIRFRKRQDDAATLVFRWLFNASDLVNDDKPLDQKLCILLKVFCGDIADSRFKYWFEGGSGLSRDALSVQSNECDIHFLRIVFSRLLVMSQMTETIKTRTTNDTILFLKFLCAIPIPNTKIQACQKGDNKLSSCYPNISLGTDNMFCYPWSRTYAWSKISIYVF